MRRGFGDAHVASRREGKVARVPAADDGARGEVARLGWTFTRGETPRAGLRRVSVLISAVICVRGPGIDGRGIARPGAAALAARFIVEPALPEQATFGLRCVPAASLYRDSALIHRGTLSHSFLAKPAPRPKSTCDSDNIRFGITLGWPWSNSLEIWNSHRAKWQTVRRFCNNTDLARLFANRVCRTVCSLGRTPQPSRKRHRQIEATRERARWGGRSRGGRWAS